MAKHAADRQARSDEVPEAQARARRARHIDRRSEKHGVALKFALQRLDLVFAPASRQVGEAGGDFLEANDVRSPEAVRLARDACGIDDAVDAAAPLHVPG